MVTRVGIIGMSPGDGHPFSFSAIINGYDEPGMAASDWPGIHAYVRRRDPADFGVGTLRVTHAWTQDPEVTGRLCRASHIERACRAPSDMLGEVDAVIVARDDHEHHHELAMPFLEAGLPVLVDKPLTLDPAELERYRPYLEEGRLMSASGLRWAMELDEVRADRSAWGELQLLRGAVVNDWARYGIHMLDALLPLAGARPVAVTPHATRHASVAIETDGGPLLLVDALGAVPKTFRIDVFGTTRVSHHEVNDNFTMFRRLLVAFAGMIETGTPAIPPGETLAVLRTLIAGHTAITNQSRIRIDEH